MKRQYEGMFLVSPSAGDGDKPLEPVRRVLDRAEAEVLVCKKWDERKLAYEVAGQKRGVYVLTYFKVDVTRIADIERDVQLSEQLLRVLILQADDVTAEVMAKPTPSETGLSPSAELSGPPDRDRGWREGRGRGGGRGESPAGRPPGPPASRRPAAPPQDESQAASGGPAGDGAPAPSAPGPDKDE